MPKTPGALMLSTGSKLVAHMREIRELDWAMDQIDQASRQPEPVQVYPHDIGGLIKDREASIRKKLVGILWSDLMWRNLSSMQYPLRMLVGPPSPWPLVPFSIPAIMLQKQIPYYLLPQKLIMHDPWNLLLINESNSGKCDKDMEWTLKKKHHLNVSLVVVVGRKGEGWERT